ncbi:hypothetical protein [Roseateles violae]|uniref:Uncharacterized protein n=1 Tax=Roseateles violae TaxID=3058042 RepID=A0ABT8E095_9BURK|nr:hypothetical protein [Pelomonas sp. PFR6]MDN3923265.1 hypothetical protein [Pelomonas sp. PFR6]
MIQRPRRRLASTIAAPKPAALAQQQSDFTAEGSPPPGKVSGTAPAAVPDGKPPPVPGRS